MRGIPFRAPCRLVKHREHPCAAAGDGVFLGQAQPGQGLAGINDARLCAGHGVDVKAGEGGGELGRVLSAED